MAEVTIPGADMAFVYHKDCIAGKCITKEEAEAYKKRGWVDNPGKVTDITVFHPKLASHPKGKVVTEHEYRTKFAAEGWTRDALDATPEAEAKVEAKGGN